MIMRLNPLEKSQSLKLQIPRNATFTIDIHIFSFQNLIFWEKSGRDI